ncbi:MAG: hypothetical protein P8Y24_06395 [Gammaproteobacteria bacterium]
MNDHVIYLDIPATQRSRKSTEGPAITPGKKYSIKGDQLPAVIHGLCGGVVFNADKGFALPLTNDATSQPCFFWDTDCDYPAGAILRDDKGTAIVPVHDLQFTSNALTLSGVGLGTPQLNEAKNTFTLQASIDLVYQAKAYPASLAILNLVESNRFSILANGDKVEHVCCEEEKPVLLLNEQGKLLTAILETPQSTETLTQNYTETIDIAMHETLGGIDVETMTVLEKYTSFFMHRQSPFSDDNIWIPVSPPITWGWSLRFSKRHDGVWCVVRQKLLKPTIGHNGMEMPEWQDHTRK